MKEHVTITGHNIWSWCHEILDEDIYFDTAAMILLRHWLGEASQIYIFFQF